MSFYGRTGKTPGRTRLCQFVIGSIPGTTGYALVNLCAIAEKAVHGGGATAFEMAKFVD
jgi:hypothetical protein